MNTKLGRCLAPALFVLAYFGANGYAAIYAFNQVADVTTRNFPAINNSGTVAFMGSISPSASGGIYTGAGGPVNTIVPVATFAAVRGVSINESGDVGFLASLSLFSGFQIYRGSTSSVTPIAAGPATFGVLPSIDDSGSVVFLKHNSDGGVFVGNGGPVTTIAPFSNFSSTQYSSVFESGAASGNGNIVYQLYSSTFESEIRTIHAGLPHTIASFNSSGDVNSIAISNSGKVALSAIMGSGDSGLYLADELSTLKVATSAVGGPYTNIQSASINNPGNYAFYASTLAGSGIFTGPDPITDKIIATGDALDGSIVTFLRFGNDALSDSGQVAFYAELANGDSGVYRGSVVPEPCSAVVAAVAFAAGGCRRPRKRAPELAQST